MGLNKPEPRALDLIEAQTILSQLAGVFFPSGFSDTAVSRDAEISGSQETEAADFGYQTLVEQIPAVIFTAFLDGAASKVYVSPYIETALGFTQEEWIKDPVRWYNQIHTDDRDRWNVEAARLFLTGEPLRSLYRVIARNGHTIWFHCQAKMVRRPNGQPWFIHGVGYDVTDLQEAKEALRRARDELEVRVQERTAELTRSNKELQYEVAERERAEMELARRADELARANADLEQFAYSAAHDIQEPIRNVVIYTQLLARQYGDHLNPDAQRIITTIVEGARRLSELVSDLLAYTRIGANTPDDVDVVDANMALSNATRNLGTLISTADAVVTHGPLPAVRIPAAHLEQLFQNLISNAIKYRGERAPRIHISAVSDTSCDRFSVSDNGIGIERQYHEQIFGLFKRLHTADSHAGTGIGLAICKRITERLGGRIWVESEPGNGSTFFFELPRNAESGSTCAAADGRADPGFNVIH